MTGTKKNVQISEENGVVLPYQLKVTSTKRLDSIIQHTHLLIILT